VSSAVEGVSVSAIPAPASASTITATTRARTGAAPGRPRFEPAANTRTRRRSSPPTRNTLQSIDSGP